MNWCSILALFCLAVPIRGQGFMFCGEEWKPKWVEPLEFEMQKTVFFNKVYNLPDYCDQEVPAPFNNPSVQDIEFRLYEGTTKNYKRLITNDKASLDSSSFNAALPLLVVIHGWAQDVDSSEWMHQIKNEWLKKKPLNVILVQWKKLAGNIAYPIPVNNAKFVGTELALLIKFVKKHTGLIAANIHIVGFSLGGQVAGVAGRNVGVARITGLDPAGALFNGAPENERLDQSDAVFVDVIHTNRGGLGFTKPCGHVDFYMNGGYLQKGCADLDMSSCSHEMGHTFYIESLKNPHSRYGYVCESQTNFHEGLCANNAKNTVGYGVAPNPNGVFYCDP